MPTYLDPKADVVFKKIFAENVPRLRSFLNALLPLSEDEQIVDLDYLSPEQTPQIPTFKCPIVDVKCRDKQGRIFIVEMQMEWVAGFTQRMLFNTSHAYVKQLNKGEHYHLSQPVYGLALLGTNFDTTSEWYHHYRIVNVKDTKRVIEGLQLIIVELEKFSPENQDHQRLRTLWLRFLNLNEKTKVIPPELLEVKEIKEAIGLMAESAYSRLELDYYNQYWDSVSREKTLSSEKYTQGEEKGFIRGREEGLQEGLQEGLLKGKLDIAKRLLELNEPIEKIMKITVLNEEQIKTLIR